MEQQLENRPQVFNPELRRYNDATTWFAEMLDGQMRTPFEYNFDGQELYASDNSALKPIFETALQEAKQLPNELSFEQRRRQLELAEYDNMISMARDELPNTMVVVSDFPSELRDAQKDVGGYNVTRQQTMLRVITKTGNKLNMYSQTLDKSDRVGLESIYNCLGFEPQSGELLGQRMHLELDETDQEFLVDQLTGVYDRSLESNYGGEWKAGQRESFKQNTYDFARNQTDLLGLYLEADVAGKADEPFIYALAATMQKRYEQKYQTAQPEYLVIDDYQVAQELVQEIMLAGKEAARAGKTFSGCGMSVGGENMKAGDQLSSLGYGNKSQEDKLGSLKFKCQKGHINKRPRNQLIPKCKTCGISVKC